MARLNKSWKAESGEVALAAELHRVLEISHRQAKGLIDSGCVKVNGEEARSHGLRLKEGDALMVDWDSARTYQALPSTRRLKEETGFKVLHEDTHLVFVDKPAGLLTVPAEKGFEANLAEALTDHYRRRGFKRFQLYIVHRLDRYTSGVLVFAKTPEALHGLKTLFGAHRLQRVYKAVLVGEIPENSGTLLGRLVERKDLKMAVVQPKKDDKSAKAAVTHYRVLERLPGHTVVEVKLETGRRNQIRVQFADRGFPLLGDQVYGQASELIDRQALHAEVLGFRHPVTDEQITITAPMPKDMENALKVLRNQRRVERAEAGVQGEEGIFKPKITKGRKFERVQRARRYAEGEAPAERPSTRTERPASGGRRSAPEGKGSGPRTPRAQGSAPKRPGGAAASPRGRKPASVGKGRPSSKPSGKTFAPRKPGRGKA
ncbi:MAG: RluA family pseudouridine synthase [Firmicutes bacterium]|nr:RluA family pseudouridine synthase [Bacillota bacterium]